MIVLAIWGLIAILGLTIFGLVIGMLIEYVLISGYLRCLERLDEELQLIERQKAKLITAQMECMSQANRQD